MKMTLTIAMILIFLQTLIGCSHPPDRPKFHPVKVKVHTIKKCGKFKYERRDGKVILDYRIARCLSKALNECGHDRKRLIIANDANVKQMETYNKETKWKE